MADYLDLQTEHVVDEEEAGFAAGMDEHSRDYVTLPVTAAPFQRACRAWAHRDLADARQPATRFVGELARAG